MSKKIIFTLVLLAYTALLFYGALSVELSPEPVTPGFDKVLHFVSFLVLSVLLFLTLDAFGLKWKPVLCFLIAMFLGLIIELAQRGIPGREFSLLDLAADFIGVVLGLILSMIFFKE